MIRRLLNLTLPWLMWMCSSLNLLTTQARSPSVMSNENPSLMVPSGIAFSIWLPIFIFCIIYGIMQFLPKYKNDPVFKQIGWWTIAGFTGVCLWGLVNAFWPMDSVQMATAIIFIPIMLILVTSMFRFDASRQSAMHQWPIAFTGISMIAGWCSIAVFLNWAPQTTRWLGYAGLTPSLTITLMLILSLIWVASVTWRSKGNIAYVFPPIWGLAWLMIERLNSTPVHRDIIFTAGVGILFLIGLSLFARRRRRTSHFLTDV